MKRFIADYVCQLSVLCQFRLETESIRCPYNSWYLMTVCIFISGTIVSVGDPKRKYTKFEKIGQG